MMRLCIAGFEPYTYLLHGFGSKTNPLFSKKIIKFLDIKKPAELNQRVHIYKRTKK